MKKPADKSRKRKRRVSDVDSPTLTKEMFANMRPASEALPGILEKSRIGRPPKAENEKKQLVSLRIDKDVLAAYRSLGDGWQTRINDTLRKHLPARSRVGRKSFAWTQKLETSRNFTRAPEDKPRASKGRGEHQTAKHR